MDLTTDSLGNGGSTSACPKTYAYSRRFRMIGDYLDLHKIIGEAERSRLSLKGLPDRLRKCVLERLPRTAPSNGSPGRSPKPSTLASADP